MTQTTRQRRAAQRAARWFIGALLLLALYYNWYRYPFSINNAGTSPTYADTPAWLSAAKYVIFLVVLSAYCVDAVLTYRRAQPDHDDPLSPRLFMASVYITLAAWALVTSAQSQGDYYLRSAIFFLVPAATILFAQAQGTRLLHAGGTVIAWFLWISLIVQFAETAAWLVLGWLPALGYPGSIFTRFGSVWDDPNGYGILIALLLPFAVERYAGFARLVAITALIIALVLTQSLTSLGALIGAWMIGNLIQFATERTFTHVKRVAWAFVIGAVAVTASLSIDAAYNALLSFASMKQESIAIHLESGGSFVELPWLSFLGMFPSGKIGESGWTNLIIGPGFAFTALYMIVMVRALLRLNRAAHRRMTGPARAFAIGGFYFLIAYLLGMSNLPYDNIFPVNLIAAILIAIAECLTAPAASTGASRSTSATADEIGRTGATQSPAT